MSARATASPPSVTGDERVALRHVAWETYERILADDEERRVPRLTYDRGVLEAASPSMSHEETADIIGDFVKAVTIAQGIPIRSVAHTTFRRADLELGFEADASFYIQHEPDIPGQREVNLLVDPPPDLVLEMEYSRSAIDKLALFASMGIPEVWRCDGEKVTIHLLELGRYRESPKSRAIPGVTSDVVTRFLAERQTTPSPEWFQTVNEWARQHPRPVDQGARLD